MVTSQSPKSRRLPIAITMGDPSGVGPEIIAKLACDPSRPTWPIIIVGDGGTMARAAAVTGVALDLPETCWPGEISDSRAYGLLQVAPSLPSDLQWGQIDARGGAASFAYLDRAIDLAMRGEVAAIVTAPINKAALFAAGLEFPGHTEILAARSGSAEVGMMLVDEDLRVMLVSVHVSLLDAIGQITIENEMKALRLAHSACRQFGISVPRIAVAGLNPHAGEGGLFGREEIEVISPAIAQARADGIDAVGPFSADTIFMRARRGEFDVVVAQYHDQGLIPIKLLGIEQGVNLTIGLPFIRASVDHGTAYDIAGTGVADHTSLRTALARAIEMLGSPHLASCPAGA